MIPRLNLPQKITKSYRSFLEALRKTGFSGDIHEDYGTRIVTSTDNSIYQVLPQSVVFPKSAEDLCLLLKLSAEDKFRSIKLTPRGGGTGTNGQSLSTGIIVDCSRHMNQILELDLKRDFVRVQPGVVLDQLNDYLRPHGVFFAPTVSPSNRATLGGMINTDACGKGSRVYGRTSDHVLELQCVLSSGELLVSVPLNLEELQKHKHLEGIRGEVFKRVDEIVTRKKRLIEDIFPDLSRFLTGYNLARVYGNKERIFNLNYLLCGSEGTLALVSEARLRLTTIPKHRQLLLLRYQSFDDALSSANLLVESGPTAIETIDETILELARGDQIYRSVSDFISDPLERPTRAINLVEFSADDPDQIKRQVEKLCGHIQANMESPGEASGYYRTSDPLEIANLWELRKKGVGLLGNLPGEEKPLPFVEDTAVPPQHLAAYIREFRTLLEKYGLKYGMFGHVDVGCLHVRPALDLKDPEQESWIRELSDQVRDLVRKYGGVMWAEHGRGYRSEYTLDFFGRELYDDLRRIKEVFDPHNRLNPGKIVTPFSLPDKVVPLEGPLRGHHDRQIHPGLRQGFPEALDCNGNGACFDYNPNHVMCPSSRITRNRIHSPKGRAGMLREWLRLLTLKSPKDAAAIAESMDAASPHFWYGGWGDRMLKTARALTGLALPRAQSRAWGKPDFSHEVYKSMAGCLACKACASQCPIHVDVPSLRSGFLQLYHTRYPRPLRDYLVAASETNAQRLAKFPRMANAILNSPPSLYLLKHLIGLVDPPRYSSKPLATSLNQRKHSAFDPEQLRGLPPGQKETSVILLQDAFTSFYESRVVLDCMDLFTRMGFKVYVAPFQPNGKPLHIKGFLEKFKHVAKRNIYWLKELAKTRIPIVGIDPSIVLSFRDEYPGILGREEMGFEILLPQEFLLRSFQHPPITKNGVSKKYLLFGHCMENSGVPESKLHWRRLFHTFGLEIEMMEVGCCGMAGTFGHEQEHVEESLGIYKMSWKRKLPHQYLRTQQVLATGFSCRAQVERFTGFRPLHPLQALLNEWDNL